MDLKLRTLFSPDEILPYNYNKYLQPFIYSLLNDAALHDSKQIKLFSYSPVQLLRNTAPDAEIKGLIPSVDSYISFRTPCLSYLEKILATIAKQKDYNFGSIPFTLEVSEVPTPTFQETVTWKTTQGGTIFTKATDSPLHLIPSTLENKVLTRTSLKHSLLTKLQALYEKDLDAVELLRLPKTFDLVKTLPLSITDLNLQKLHKEAKHDTTFFSWGGFTTIEAPRNIQHAIHLLGLGTRTADGYGHVNPSYRY